MRIFIVIFISFIGVSSLAQEPFALETLTGDTPSFTAPRASYKPAPKLNEDVIYKVIIGCYPMPSAFNIDVTAQGRMGRYGSDTSNPYDSFYGGIVVSMPLFSTDENYRVREMEFNRRTRIAELVGILSKASAQRNLAARKITLYEALERRSQVRVATGIVAVTEQVTYLENIANEYSQLAVYDAEAESARIQLLSHCSNDRVTKVTRWLNSVIKASEYTVTNQATKVSK